MILESHTAGNGAAGNGADHGRPSLRERKKLATRHAIRRVALDLVSERGFSQVTVEDIADAADVSPRTFFNYFPSKEAAILGSGPERWEGVRRRLTEQPPGLSPFEAVRAAMVQELGAMSEELAELGGDPALWLHRLKAAQVDPHLRAAQATHMVMIERAVATGVANRIGADPKSPYCQLLASTAMGALRAAISIWASGAEGGDLRAVADECFQALAEGFPQDWDPARGQGKARPASRGRQGERRPGGGQGGDGPARGSRGAGDAPSGRKPAGARRLR